MSYVLRTRSSLPPLHNEDKQSNQRKQKPCHYCKNKESLRTKEDSTLLSLSAFDALTYMLPGFSLKCIDKCSPMQAMDPSECSCYSTKEKCSKSNFLNDKKTSTNNDNDVFLRCNINKANNNAPGVHTNMTLHGNDSHVHSPGSFNHIKGDTSLTPPQESPDSLKNALVNNNYVHVDEGNTSDVAEVTTSLSISLASSQLSEDDLQAIGDLELESDAITDSLDKSSRTSNASSGNNSSDHAKFCQLKDHQKVGSLKDAHSNSTAYLDDYLNILTTRSFSHTRFSEKSRNGSFEDSTLHRRCSVPTFRSRSESSKYDRKRNLSGSSDRSNRSLGSTYLDSYLGNLTEHAWIIYPTETTNTKTTTSKAKEKVLKIVEPKRSSRSSSHQRRLHFIDPDKFFNQNLSKHAPQKSSLSSSASLISNCSDKDVDSMRSRSNTIDSATSPDISSSIFDKDLEDGSPVKSCTIDSGIVSQEYIGSDLTIDEEDTIKESHSYSENSETCMSSLKSCSSEQSHSTSGVMSMSLEASSMSHDPKSSFTDKEDILISDCLVLSEDTNQKNSVEINQVLHHDKNSSLSLDKLMHNLSDKSSKLKSTDSKVQNEVQFRIGGKVRIDSQIEEEHSSSSDLSSATEPSTIVLAGDQQQHISDLEQSSLSSDVEKAVVNSYEEKRVNFSQSADSSLKMIKKKNGMALAKNTFQENAGNCQSLMDFNEDEELAVNVDPAVTLLEMLKAKHQKEINELRARQAEEIQEFRRRLQEFSASELTCLLDSYRQEGKEIPSNFNSLNEVPDVSPTALVSDVTYSQDYDKNQSYFSPSNPAVTPSFFLHEKENNSLNDNGTAAQREQKVISRLFGAAKTANISPPKSISDIVKSHSSVVLCDSTHSSSYSCEMTPSKSLVATHLPSHPNVYSHSRLGSKSYTSRIQGLRVERDEHFETGLDLIPAREKDLECAKKQQIPRQKTLRGICKLQALIKGRRIRQLMKTKKVQQLLRTLLEVSKLASDFHKDILSANVKKGDVDFHKALFQEEEQSRRKLYEIFIEAKPVEQLKIIREDKAAQLNEHSKKSSLPIRRLQHLSPKPLQTHIKPSQPANKTNKVYPLNKNNPKVKGRLMVSNSSHLHHREVHALPTRLCSESPRLCRSSFVQNEHERRGHSISPHGPRKNGMAPMATSRSFIKSPSKIKGLKLEAEVIPIHKSRNSMECSQHSQNVSIPSKKTGLPQWKNVPRTSSIPRKPWR